MGLFSRQPRRRMVGDTIMLSDATEPSNLRGIAPYLERYPHQGAWMAEFDELPRMDVDDVLDDPEVQELRIGQTAFVDDDARETRDPLRLATWCVTRQSEALLVEFWYMFDLDESDDYESADEEHWRLEFAQAIPIRPVRTWERA